jgi:hypothetical protein
MISGRDCDDLMKRRGGFLTSQGMVRPSKFEGSGALEIFTFQEDGATTVLIEK